MEFQTPGSQAKLKRAPGNSSDSTGTFMQAGEGVEGPEQGTAGHKAYLSSDFNQVVLVKSSAFLSLPSLPSKAPGILNHPLPAILRNK